jgi:poly(hydroxyalkanoate) depolymerase family esterase
MAKSYGSIWLKGLNRLMKIQREQARRLEAQRKKAAAAARRATPARERAKAGERSLAGTLDALGALAARVRTPVRARTQRPGAVPRQTKHTPPQGIWTRSFFSAPPAAGELVNHLVYGLYLPPARPNAALPLVVMLHGCKQTIEDFAQGTRMNALADRHGFAVLYPEQSKHAQAHRCWRWYDDSAHAGGKEAGSIAALVQEVVRQQGLDPSRVYAAGMSAGAGMAALLALHHPQLFAAVALHSAPALGGAHTAAGALAVMRRGVRGDPVAQLRAAFDLAHHPGMPALLVQGAADPVVAAVNTDQLELQFLALNRVLAAERPAAAWPEPGQPMALHDYRLGRRAIVRTCRVAGLAHGWSGGDDSFAFHSARGPDASALIWEFFSTWQRE